MLQSLEIENFRQFSHFTIPKLGRINLLTGKNNSGKTSVLEAIYLLMTQEHPAQIMTELQLSRGEISPAADPQKYASEIIHFFHNRKITSQNIIKISGLSNTYQKELTIQLVMDDHKTDSIITFDAFSKDFQESTRPKILINRKKTGSKDTQYGGTLSPDREIVFQKSGDIQSPLHQDQDVDFMISTKATSQEAAYLYNEVVLQPTENLVLEAAKILEPKIQRIAPRYVDIERIGSIPKQGFFAKVEGFDEIIPLASMGDGLWRILGLVLVLVSAKNKILLVDEIDTGFHYSVMVDLWKLIWKSAKKLDIQVFATTHSRDCWEALGELIHDEGEEQLNSDDIIIHRINSQRAESVSIFTDEIIDAVQSQIEVR
ncbi:ATP-binding protein [Limnothrix sp. FACHB-1088]|nr:ATP-binding protein [Limnothrix sp. FACHB-1088]